MADPVWISRSTLGESCALVLARTGDESVDVLAVTARTNDRRQVLALRDVSNLTRSPGAEEGGLTANGRWAAYWTRVGDDIVAFTLVDLAGTPEALSSAGDRGARFRGAVTRLQSSGRWQGYGLDRFDLSRPVRSLSLRLDGERLVADAGARSLTVDAPSRAITAGADPGNGPHGVHQPGDPPRGAREPGALAQQVGARRDRPGGGVDGE